MIFASDNWAAIHPKIADNVSRHSVGYAPAYGNSDLDKSVEAIFAEIFECELSVYFVATGTAANSLSIAATNKPGASSICGMPSSSSISFAGARIVALFMR